MIFQAYLIMFMYFYKMKIISFPISIKHFYNVLLFVILTCFIWACENTPEAPKYIPKGTTINMDSLLNTYHLKNGDIVFRKGLSIESQAVLLADRDGMYSHIGIIILIDSIPYVIHIVPDSLESTPDFAQLEKLNEFFAPKYATIGCVVRVKSKYETQANNAALMALEFYHNKVIFDASYDLSTNDEMYCTELVSKAYLKNGIDLVEGRLSKMYLPFPKHKIIFPTAIINSQYLENIYYF